MKKRSTTFIVITALMGVILEWYDFAVFAFLAPFISQVFFPSEKPFLSLLFTYATFAVGFILRPLGGMLFGHIGDIYGRKRSVLITILLMTLPTVAIGLLPGYQQLGITACLLLIAMRLIQGLSVGGETAGSLALVFESSPQHQRAFTTTAVFIGGGLGILSGSLVVTLMTTLVSAQAMMQWGWRIPFLLAFATGIVGYLLRRTIAESPEYLESLAQKQLSYSPVKESLKFHKHALLKIFILFIPDTVGFYLFYVFMPPYVHIITKLPLQHLMMVNTGGMLFALIFATFMGWVADKIHQHRNIMLWSSVCLVLFAIPLFKLFHQGTLLSVFFGQLGVTLLLGSYVGPLAAISLKMLPMRVRFTGLAMSYNLCNVIFGSTAPLLATSLAHLGYSHFIIFYFLATVLAGIAALCFTT